MVGTIATPGQISAATARIGSRMAAVNCGGVLDVPSSPAGARVMAGSASTSTSLACTDAGVPSDRHEPRAVARSEEHTSELQSLMRISYAVFCLKKQRKTQHQHQHLKT